MLTKKKYLIKEGNNIRLVNNPGINALYEEGSFILAKLTQSSYRILSPKRFRHLGLIVKENDNIEFVTVDKLIFP